jgi:hypothetical protein
MRSARRAHTLLLSALLLVAPAVASAQVRDSARVRADTAPMLRARGTGRLAPPITPRRAFLYSLLLPGLGQSRLDRGTSGALFSSVELAALVMVRRSQADVREAKRYRLDSLPAEFTVSGGLFRGTGALTSRFTGDLVRTRRLHVEDWLAVLAFNHLFAGADAFVGAQLWDVPMSVSARPVVGGGGAIVATIHW